MFFLNPYAMVIGGAMVSAPILIHLINRMRFKRVRWAAMEFLLKSQKRNRRRLIIEQLILLALRCLLVLLFGLLMARFVAQAVGTSATSSTTHVIVFDDTLSMTDSAPKPGFASAYEQAKQHIIDLAANAVEAPSAQHLVIVPMSDRERTLFNDRLSDESLGRLRKALDDHKPTLMHVAPVTGIEAGRTLLDNAKDSKRWLHLVSDFRDRDWNGRTVNNKLHETLKEIADGGVSISLIDCATPLRANAEGKTPDFHNNFAITRLEPEKRVVPAGSLVKFFYEIENFGIDVRDSLRVEVFADGSEDLTVSTVIEGDLVPRPGEKKQLSFEKNFEGPAEGQTTRFHRVTVRLDKVDNVTGLKDDNVRHALVEVRRPKDINDLERRGVPTLVVDGSKSQKPGSDARCIKDALKTLKGVESVDVVIAERGLDELLRPDLEREYATIYLLNVERLGPEVKKKDDKDKDRQPEAGANEKKDKEKKATVLERLQQFVANGGNVVWFTGDKVDPKYYTDILFEESRGLFPVPIADQGKSTKLSDKEIDAQRKSGAPKIFVLDQDHTITYGLARFDRSAHTQLLILQHTLAKERFEWVRPWGHESDVKELISLAKLTKNDDLARKRLTNADKTGLLDRIRPDDEELKLSKKVKERLGAMKAAIIKASLDGRDDEMYKVIEAIDRMLLDRGDNPNDKENNVSLEAYWALPETVDIRAELAAFRKDALLGAPLVVTRKVGKGNVVAFLTTPGEEWSGWSGGEFSGPVAHMSFPAVITDLQKFLTRGGDAGQRHVGERIRIEADPLVYKDEIVRVIQADEGKAEQLPEGAPAGFKVEAATKGQNVDGKLVFTFPPVPTAGVHSYRLFPLQGGSYEERWFVFNVDTEAESNLRRVASADVARNPADAPPGRGKIEWSGIAEMSSRLREKRHDLSESPWIYLIFLIVLIAEQALAVHLSFHVKGSEPAQAKGPAQVAADTSAREQRREAAGAAS